MNLPEKLKAETQEAHQQLEQHPLLQLLVSDQVTVADYRRVLEQFYGFFAPLEQQILQTEGLTHFLSDFGERRKSALLLSDLQNLPGSTGTETPELYANAPLPQSLAACFGCLYVLEGSTLGGQFISRKVSANLGADAGKSLRFFQGYGPRTGHYWKTFREALQAFGNFSGTDEVIVQAANSTFHHFNTWLTINEYVTATPRP